MKRKKSTVDRRREELLSLIRQSDNDRLNTEELASRLEISPITLRRDLVVLQDAGLIQRSYGRVSAVDVSSQTSTSLAVTCRDRIARKAASLVEDGDTIFINTSSTALQMLEHITARNVTVITNNSKAVYSTHNSDINIILTGGEVRFPKHALVGDFALRSLQPVFARKSFVGCSGLSPECGMTTENANEVNINILMLQQVTGPVYVLADHTKIGYNSSFTSADIHQISNVITDSEADETILARFQELGIQVFLS